MIYSDLHMHTSFCDGKDSPEDMVVCAIEKGLKRVGVCVHSYTDMDGTYCIKFENIKPFIAEMARLKDKYADKIEVLCGVEQDYFSNYPIEEFDYAIGSLHYFFVDGKFYHVDHSRDYFENVVKKVFNGDYYCAVENYYSTLATVMEKTKADIVGHFDLIIKFNEGNRYFDQNNPRYVKAWQTAADRILKSGKPFEINTGAISRGYKTTPYPSLDVIKYLKARGAKFIMSSDSHSKENIAFQYREWFNALSDII